MIEKSCTKCDRCGDVRTELNVKDALRGIILIYALPFVCFLIGIFLGLLFFKGLWGRPLYSIFLGFLFMLVSYIVLPKRKGRG